MSCVWPCSSKTRLVSTHCFGPTVVQFGTSWEVVLLVAFCREVLMAYGFQHWCVTLRTTYDDTAHGRQPGSFGKGFSIMLDTSANANAVRKLRSTQLDQLLGSKLGRGHVADAGAIMALHQLGGVHRQHMQQGTFCKLSWTANLICASWIWETFRRLVKLISSQFGFSTAGRHSPTGASGKMAPLWLTKSSRDGQVLLYRSVEQKWNNVNCNKNATASTAINMKQRQLQ